MGKFYAFLMGCIAGFATYHIVSSYHVVRAESGFHLTSKVVQTLDDTYVDIREFGVDDWAKHADLAAAIARSDNKELLDGAIETAITDGINSILPSTRDDHSAE